MKQGFVVLAAAVLAVSTAAQGGRVGQILDLKGSVQLQRAGRTQKVFLLSAVEAGDVIRVPMGGKAEVILDAGRRRQVLLGGSVCRAEAGRVRTLNGKLPVEGRRVAAAKKLSRDSGRFAGELRFENPGPPPPDPVGGCREAPDALRWFKLRRGREDFGARRVRVEVRRADAAGNSHGRPILTAETEFQLGKLDLHDEKIQAGVPHYWTLTLLGTGKPDVEIGRWSFRVLTAGERSDLARLEKQLENSTEIPDLLDLALAYERLQLFAEAAGRYQRVLERSPGNRALEQALQRNRRDRLETIALPPRPPEEQEDP